MDRRRQSQAAMGSGGQSRVVIGNVKPATGRSEHCWAQSDNGRQWCAVLGSAGYAGQCKAQVDCAE